MQFSQLKLDELKANIEIARYNQDRTTSRILMTSLAMNDLPRLIEAYERTREELDGTIKYLAEQRAIERAVIIRMLEQKRDSYTLPNDLRYHMINSDIEAIKQRN